MSLDPKRVLIIGASSGIGLQLAEDYARSGHAVYACGLATDELFALEKNFPGQVYSAEVDICSAEEIALYAEHLPAIDIAILNAGIIEFVDIAAIDIEVFRKVFEVNFFGQVNCVKALLNHQKLARGSQLVIMGSIVRQMPFTHTEAYGSSKAALHYFARALQVDLRPRGIDVQTISPYYIDTSMGDKNIAPKPLMVSAARASKIIRRGIGKRKTDIAFPRHTAWIAAFFALLPQKLQVLICYRLRGYHLRLGQS